MKWSKLLSMLMITVLTLGYVVPANAAKKTANPVTKKPKVIKPVTKVKAAKSPVIANKSIQTGKNDNTPEFYYVYNPPRNFNETLNGITYANGLFTAVGEMGAIVSSPDAANWVKTTSNSQATLKCIAYGNGVYVAAGSVFLSSRDGTKWLVSQLPLKSFSINDVVFADNRFIAVGTDYDNHKGLMLTSSDGASWKTIDTDKNIAELSGIAYGNNTFIAVSRQGYILSSADGTQWNQKNMSINLADITYSQGEFVAVGGIYGNMRDQKNTGVIMVSKDGATWKQFKKDTGMGVDVTISLVAYGNDRFIAFGRSSDRYISSNGLDWAKGPSGISPNAVVYGMGKFVAVGYKGQIMTSSDGYTWGHPGKSIEALCGVAYGNGRFVAVGNNSFTASSLNGTDWDEKQLQTDRKCLFRSVAFGNDRFVALADEGVAAVTTDGVSWETGNYDLNPSSYNNGKMLVFTSSQLYDVTYGNGKFVAVGGFSCNAVATSTDGLKWAVNQITPKGYGLLTVYYINGQFYAGGGSGQLLCSKDGINWRTILPPFNSEIGEDTIRSIAFGNGKYVMTTDNKVFVSSNGIKWNRISAGRFNKVAFAKGKFLGINTFSSSEYGDTVYTSVDGVNWSKVNYKGSTLLSGVGYGNNHFILVGANQISGGVILMDRY